MKVSLKTITPDIERTIVEIARVSSSRQDKSEDPAPLINYLILNKHWSPFEHGFLTFEVETSKAIAIQLLRHRSNYFQEFSQRYQDVKKVSDDGVFEPIELRQQARTNRQSSTEVFDPAIDINLHFHFDGEEVQWMGGPASEIIEWYLKISQEVYDKLLEAGVAKECARMILPMCTKTRLFISMNVRSVIHWLDLRDDSHAQKEVQLIAREVKKIVIRQLPLISRARGYTEI